MRRRIYIPPAVIRTETETAQAAIEAQTKLNGHIKKRTLIHFESQNELHIIGYRGSEYWFGYLLTELDRAPCNKCGEFTKVHPTKICDNFVPSMSYHGVNMYSKKEYREITYSGE